ncbi:hypothetical protein ACOMHN_021365 [Nucella lapillus]
MTQTPIRAGTVNDTDPNKGRAGTVNDTDPNKGRAGTVNDTDPNKGRAGTVNDTDPNKGRAGTVNDTDPNKGKAGTVNDTDPNKGRAGTVNDTDPNKGRAGTVNDIDPNKGRAGTVNDIDPNKGRAGTVNDTDPNKGRAGTVNDTDPNKGRAGTVNDTDPNKAGPRVIASSKGLWNPGYSFIQRTLGPSWLNPLFTKGRQRPLEVDDMFNVTPDDSSDYLGANLDREWQREVKAGEESEGRHTPSLLRALLRLFGMRYLLLGILVFIEEGVRVVQPLLLGGLIRYFTPGSQVSSTEAYLYALGVSVCAAVIAVTHHPYFFGVTRMGMQMRVACCSLMYKKTLCSCCHLFPVT